MAGELTTLGLARRLALVKGGGVVGQYLPDAAVAPLGGWSVQKLYAPYAGNALQATRLSPAADQDIGFVGPSFDLASAQTFKGASTLTNKKVYEQHSNSLDLVPQSASPDLWLGNGGPDWSTYTQNAPMVIPSGIQIDRRDCALFLVVRTPGMGAATGYFSFGSGADDFALRSYSSQYTLQPVVDGVVATAAAPNNKTIGVCGNSLIVIHSNATRLRVWRDGEYTDFPPVTSKTLNVGGLLGRSVNVAGRLDILAFEVFGAAISDADVSARQQAYKAKFGTASLTSIARSILGAGDSIMFGTGGLYNRTQLAELALLVPDTTIIRNVGIAGHFMGGPNLASGHYQDWQTSSTRFTTAGAENILVINYGHNDIYQYVANQGKTAAQAIAEMQAAFKLYCADARNLAGFAKIIIQETLPDTSGGTSWTAVMEDARNQWNTWINTAPVDANGVLCWNAVDKVATDATFVLSNAETTAGRGMALTSNSSDGTHPNEVTAPARGAHLKATLDTAPANPLSLSYAPVQVANQNSAYIGATPVASNGSPPYTYSIASGVLPAGLSVSPSTGVISGTPTTIETKTGLVLRVTDNVGATADSAAFQIAVGVTQQVVVASTTVSQNSTDNIASSVALPGAVAAGDVLLAVVSLDANATITWDNTTAGAWTASFNDAQTANRLAIFSKVADGSEGGKTLSVTYNSAQQSETFVFRLTGAQGALAFSATGTRGSGTTVDPPSLSSGFPAGNNTFWLSALALDNFITSGGTITQPSGYGNLQTQTSSASGQATLATAYKSAATASDDPGAWNWTGTCAYVHALVAVRAA